MSTRMGIFYAGDEQSLFLIICFGKIFKDFGF